MEMSEIAKDAAKYIDWREYRDNLCDGCPYYNPENNDPCSYVHEKSGLISCVRIAECVQQAIDESTAEKDAEIEGLREELALSKKDSLRITALEEWGAYKFENGLGHTREVEDPWAIRGLLDAIGSEVGVIEEVDKEESDGDQ